MFDMANVAAWLSLRSYQPKPRNLMATFLEL